MIDLTQQCDDNRVWGGSITKEDPEFFSKLTGQQVPDYLWIGCADSRVPANELVELKDGHLKNLDVSVNNVEQIPELYRLSLS